MFDESFSATALLGFLPFFLAVAKVKGALSGLRHFLATEIPLKMMKNTFIST